MNKKIVSFGDSFIFGHELMDNDDGSQAWPGLIAKKLSCDYETLAISGCGNDNIAKQIYSYFSKNSTDDVIAIINWTWASRWDFYIFDNDEYSVDFLNIRDYVSKEHYEIIAGSDWPPYKKFISGILDGILDVTPSVLQEIMNFINSLKNTISGHWITLGSTCVPEKLSWLNNSSESKRIIDFYNDYPKNSVLWANFKTLQSISAIQYFLTVNNIKNIQTYMDYEMFDNHDTILAPDYVMALQNLIKPNLELFHNDRNFLDWAKDSNYQVTPQPMDHPLEEAHQAACDLWIDRYQKKLNE